MFIIDLDNTLIDTADSFTKARMSALEKLGIDKDLYEKTYSQARNREGSLAIYNNKRHAKALTVHGFDELKVLDALNESLGKKEIKKFLYSDAISFLENLKKFKLPLILLTFGNPSFQEEKIKQLEIEKYFDRVIMTNDKKALKVEQILETLTDRPAWFINDRILENVEISKLEGVNVVQKQYKFVGEEEYEETSLPYFKTLTEIYDFISRKIK